jgi:hypothetical protein
VLPSKHPINKNGGGLAPPPLWWDAVLSLFRKRPLKDAIQIGDVITVLKGSLRGKRGQVQKVGTIFIHVSFPGMKDLNLIKKTDILRIVNAPCP